MTRPTASIDATARIHDSALIEDNVSIGADTAVWDHAHIRHGARIGARCIVGEKSYIAYDVVIGDLVKINGHASICAGVTIEDGCMISAHAVFTNDRAPRAADPDLTKLLDSEPGSDTLHTTVRRGATVGANATIGPGLDLGSYCMIGMGSVVTRDVPPHALVVGNPARLVGFVARDGRRVWTASSQGAMPSDGTSIDCGDGITLRIVEGSVRLHRGQN